MKIPPNTTVDTCRKMLQNFLAERFHMVTETEIRDVPRYHLKVAKSGLKLKPVKIRATDPQEGGKLTVNDGVAHFTFRGSPMSKIVNSIRASAIIEADSRSVRETGHGDDFRFRLATLNTVVDDTGLAGYYDGGYELRTPAATRGDELAETLPDALKRQLGLTLELEKSPGKVLVILSSDRTPTEN